MQEIHADKLSFAPMMDWTDRHCRYFHRLIVPDVTFFTEMITAMAIIHGEAPRLLGFDESEKPLILQLGGSEPSLLAKAISIAEPYNYNGYDLNCGCPSPRVQKGAFGASLMKEAPLVAECLTAMQNNTDKPVSVKCRIGVDDVHPHTFLPEFIDTIYQNSPCRAITIHARKALLNGLSPKDNRTIPPLDYDLVYTMKTRFPDMHITINGGFDSIEKIIAALTHTDGVMIGRTAYQNPLFWCDLLGHKIDRFKIIEQMALYSETQTDTPVKSIARHMLGLFNGLKGAKEWRRYMSEHVMRPDANAHTLRASINVFEKSGMTAA